MCTRDVRMEVRHVEGDGGYSANNAAFPPRPAYCRPSTACSFHCTLVNLLHNVECSSPPLSSALHGRSTTYQSCTAVDCRLPSLLCISDRLNLHTGHRLSAWPSKYLPLPTRRQAFKPTQPSLGTACSLHIVVDTRDSSETHASSSQPRQF